MQNSARKKLRQICLDFKKYLNLLKQNWLFAICKVLFLISARCLAMRYAQLEKNENTAKKKKPTAQIAHLVFATAQI